MYWRPDICDKVMYEKFSNSHLQSGFHKRLANPFMRKYIITSPKPNKLDDTVRKHSRLHYRKYEKFLVIYTVKLIMPSNQNKYIRRKCSYLLNHLYINDHSFFSKSKINKEQLYSQILELGITFVSRFEDMEFEYYLTKPKSMLEWKLCAMLDKNHKSLCKNFVYKRFNHHLFRELNDIHIDFFY